MVARMQPTTVADYERRAEEAAASPLPMFLKVGRVVVWCIYALALIAVVILLMSFLLRLFGASTDASFTQWMYRSADSIMRPFRGIFPTRQLNDVSVFDPSLLFGAICYTVAALAADALHHWLSRRLRAQEAAISRARAEADATRHEFERQQTAMQLAVQQQHTPPPVPPTVRIEVPGPAPQPPSSPPQGGWS
jgi:uncharacterized protein YggT (Ycf19 family)